MTLTSAGTTILLSIGAIALSIGGAIANSPNLLGMLFGLFVFQRLMRKPRGTSGRRRSP